MVDSCRQIILGFFLYHIHTCRGTQCAPVCTNDCSGHGECVAPGNCSCDLGYIADDCGIECLCNGHSDCKNETEAGRRECLECLHNTQVRDGKYQLTHSARHIPLKVDVIVW